MIAMIGMLFAGGADASDRNKSISYKQQQQQIINGMAEKERQIDLSEQMGITDKTDKYASDVVSVSTSKDGRQLFILTHGGIFVYDRSTQALVSKLSIDDSDAQQIYMWTNR